MLGLNWHFKIDKKWLWKVEKKSTEFFVSSLEKKRSKYKFYGKKLRKVEKKPKIKGA